VLPHFLDEADTFLPCVFLSEETIYYLRLSNFFIRDQLLDLRGVKRSGHRWERDSIGGK